jgi:hypothetical protein
MGRIGIKLRVNSWGATPNPARELNPLDPLLKVFASLFSKRDKVFGLLFLNLMSMEG